VLPALSLPQPDRSGGPLSKLLAPRTAHFYPDTVHRPRIAAALAAWNADALMVPWSEWLTAACADIPVLRFAYYGNPDHKTGLHRAQHDRSLGGSSLAYARLRIALSRLERVHLETMRRYHLLGDVAANDAAFYASRGHPNAFYIRNVWIDRFGEGWRAQRDRLEQTDPFVIIGSVGQLGATANRYGLEYLGREVLPALRRRMPAGSWRVEILGAGSLQPEIRRHLECPEVVFRGFVPDIDEAMLAAPVFLCVNNASPFKVGHTRYLHAWTLGACVVAHRDAGLSMPEIVHGRNALFGTDGDSIAAAIAQAASDPALRRRIGEGGWETYRTQFRAGQVAADIAARLGAAARRAMREAA
jgi:glycosyltransferase involved in cell wall biosynthesis